MVVRTLKPWHVGPVSGLAYVSEDKARCSVYLACSAVWNVLRNVLYGVRVKFGLGFGFCVYLTFGGGGGGEGVEIHL